VHNAAAGAPGVVGRIDVDEFRAALETNVVAPLALTQELLPALSRGAAPSRVLHLGTSVADRVQKGTGAYGISKIAFRRLAAQCALDLGGAVLCGSLCGNQPLVWDVPTKL